jgi:RimJ/RimL family protein N-acetyltransferase
LTPFAAMNCDPRVMEFFPKLYSKDESDTSAAKFAQHICDRGFGLWAVEIPGESTFIGFVGLATTVFDAPFTPREEIGWRIAYEYWGRGYAVEAATAALNDVFARFDFKEIVSYTAVPNLRSRRVMEKLGMTHSPSEDFDHPMVDIGHPLRRHVLYRLSRDDWKSRTLAR